MSCSFVCRLHDATSRALNCCFDGYSNGRLTQSGIPTKRPAVLWDEPCVLCTLCPKANFYPESLAAHLLGYLDYASESHLATFQLSVSLIQSVFGHWEDLYPWLDPMSRSKLNHVDMVAPRCFR